MRLIDADKILDALNIFSDKENGNKHFMYGIETAKELIEDTLEEQEANACDYCENNRKQISALYDLAPMIYEVIEIPINFCPICGRRLKHED